MTSDDSTDLLLIEDQLNATIAIEFKKNDLKSRGHLTLHDRNVQAYLVYRNNPFHFNFIHFCLLSAHFYSKVRIKF